MEFMMAIQAIFYHSPDSNPGNRQHGHFIQHPQQMPMYPVVPTLPSTPIYSRRNSCSQPAQPPKAFTAVLSNMTPMVSPQPIAHKRAILLEADVNEADGLHCPSTPSLSTSGSVISKPGSCEPATCWQRL